jgi:hypothetical protein
VTPESRRSVESAASSAVRIEVSLAVGAGAGGKNNRGGVKPQRLGDFYFCRCWMTMKISVA